MLNRIICVFLCTFVMVSGFLTTASPHATIALTNDCPGWARERGATAYTLTLAGCKKTTKGWSAKSGTCEYYARREARRGYRGMTIPAKINARGYSVLCGYDNFGTYYIAWRR